MEALNIEIVNPKVKKILMDLEELNLITIGKSLSIKNDFTKLLAKLRSHSTDTPSLAEITKEVDLVRSKRYENKGK